MTKRITSMFAALLMAAALALGASATAFAADDGSIKVTGDELTGKTVSAYRMFDVTGSGDTASYKLDSAFEKFFTDAANDKYGCSGKTSDDLSAAAYAYVNSLGKDDEKEVIAFAKEAETWVKAQNPALTATATAVGANDVATLSGLAYGYYLVYPEGGSTSVDRQTDAMLVNVKDATQVNLNLKSEYPTVDKQITDNTGHGGTNAGDAQIGDTITFTLTATVPDMSDYTTYTFKFHDTLSAGLTFNQVTGVTIKGATVTENTDYKVTVPTVTAPAVGGGDLTVEMLDMKNRTPGDKIVVTYTATLNQNAVVGNTGNTNSATVEYSNDPASGGTGTSKPDVTKTHTFDFTVDKYTGTYSADAQRLAGAEFELRTTVDKTGDAFQLVKEAAAGDVDVYHVATPTEKADNAVTKVTTFVTPVSGKVQIKGLAAGTYYLHETKAPAGYNELAAPLKVTIAATYDQTTGELTGHTVTYGDPATNAEKDDVIPVQNNTGTILPGTGGMGTVALTVGGVLLIVAGVAWMVLRRKRSNGEV